MDFYSQILAKKLSDGDGGGGDNYEAFRKLIDGSITMVTAEMLKGITRIDDYAFYKCSNLLGIVLPNSATIIGKHAFHNCQKLTSINIPTRVTRIDEYAFQNCSSLTSIEIPSGVTVIYRGVFSACGALRTVVIQTGVQQIDHSAFTDCSSLTEVEVPSTVFYVGGSSFLGCRALKKITFYSITPPSLFSNNAFNSTSSELVIYVPSESVEAYKAAQNWSTYADKIQAIPNR